MFDLKTKKVPQILFCFVPLAMLSFYSLFYILDLLNTFGTIQYNNTLVEVGLTSGQIKPVSDVSYDEDTGLYGVHIKGSSEKTLENIKIDETIFDYVVSDNKMGFLEFEDESAIRVTSFDGLTYKSSDSDGIVLDYNGKEIVVEDVLQPVFRVFLNKDLKFEIEFLQGNIKDHVVVDSLSCIKVLSIAESTVDLEVKSDYEIVDEELNINYCTKLESDSFYFDEDKKALLKNVSQDLVYTFMLKCRLPITMISMLGLMVLFYVIKKIGTFTVLSRKEPLLYNSILIVVVFSILIVATIGLLL